MDEVQTVVIGAGVVGLAVARELAQQGHEVLILESGSAFGMGVSSRNSEVIHAGLYYPTGSLKATLCLRGRTLLYAYCVERGVAHQRCGKLLVASSDAQVGQLDQIAEQAARNGVDDLVRLSAQQTLDMEPGLRAAAALWSPSTGIIDSHGLMLALLGDVENASGLLALNTPVVGAQCSESGIVLCTADGTQLRARHVVNAAGLHAPALARQFDGLDADRVPKAYFAKGNYFSLSGRAPFRHLIYPVPEPGGLGIHLTLDLAGQARFGPDVQWVESAADLAVDPARAPSFANSVRRYWPGLPADALLPAYAGIRPKIHGPGERAADFMIQGPQDHGVPGLVNLFGIESPGLTSALAIGEHVRDMLA